MQSQTSSTIIILTAMTMIVATVVVASGILFGSQTINNAGNINSIGVGVYWETECENEIETIDWGYMEPGSNQNVTVYIRNEGNVAMVLNMSTDNWNPAPASGYITLEWDRESNIVNGDSVLEATLNLQISAYVTEISNFNFDITIAGTEQSN
ncbi:MAG: hypothetical protein NWF11_06810 [Candidatus Bathyarchaeota archaeon]|nr:hypothetical protein [Candidatus Bathyarchaeota archaeon]